MESQLGAELLRPISHHRAPERDIEGAIQRSTFAREHIVDQRFLVSRHLLVSQRPEPVAPQMKIPHGWRLTDGHTREHHDADWNHLKAHDHYSTVQIEMAPPSAAIATVFPFWLMAIERAGPCESISATA